MKIRVMTWNIRHGRGTDDRQDLRRILEVIKDVDPDICVLNEVDRRMARSGFIDQVRWLAANLSLSHYFSPSLGIRPVGYGNAIISKGTFVTTRFSHLSLSWEPRKALITDIDIRGTRLTCIGVHLNIVRAFRAAEYKRLTSVLHALNRRVILAGDFNTRPEAPEITALSKRFVDAFADEPQPTFPANDPRKRIDYIFISSGCDIIGKKVLNVEGSDHLPLYVEVDI